MLSPYRVLDLTNERGLLCGQMLADLGADVIQIEPPGGSSARRIGPFAKDERDPERSLFWWAYARNKRGVVLDLESEAGRERLRKLAAGADFLIESGTPGRMATLGLGYEDLAAVNPALVYVSITPFGQEGPKAGWADSDLILMAAGGHAYLSGEAERPPVRLRVPQAHAHAGADAAVGALIAHAERKRSGRGQHVDISTQQSVTLATMFRILDAPLEQVPARRVSGGALVGGAFLRSLFEVRDGHVILGPAFLPSTGHFMVRLLNYARDEGYEPGALLDEDWGSFALRLIAGQVPRDAYEPVDALLDAFFREKTKGELMKAAVERKLLLAPALALDEVIESEQLAEREFFVTSEQPGADAPVRVPGPFAKFARTPIRYARSAPRVDEHGAELQQEPGRKPAAFGNTATPSPLDGVKILDLFWVLAGPGSTRMLADYGATVVKVESTRSLDTLRVIPPYQFSHPHPEGAGGFQCANANKLNITLDLSSEQGRNIALELVDWADVVTESFAPGVIDQYGLGYETLRQRRPDLIMISSCLAGQTGPWRDFSGFGNLAASVTGFQQLASWPGRPPSGPFGAYTDFIAVRYNAACILAALEYRERTGEGQYIDQAQGEAALHFLAPALLDYTINGRVQGAAGNEDGDLFPHGVFPAAGEDRWLAIAVRDDAEWRALCDVIARPDLLDLREERELVESAISAWTRARSAEDGEADLQDRGVPAHVTLTTPDLFADPQLQQRGHFIEVEHEIYGTSTVESTRLRLSRTPARSPTQAVSFGRDNRRVLETILGYSPEQIAGLAEQGILL